MEDNKYQEGKIYKIVCNITGEVYIGSTLKTAVTGKVKKGSKAAKRRKSYCARSAGQMKQFPKAAKNPNSRLRQARKRWKC
jgi:hypothetical protein